MTTFETEEDIRREKKAINTFVNVFGGSFQKLGTQDVDYKIFNKDKALIAYVEIKGVIRNIRNAYPLPMTIGKLSKLMDKRLNPVIIWCCDDGIIYANPTLLTGIVKFDNELIVYYDKQRPMKYVRFQ